MPSNNVVIDMEELVSTIGHTLDEYSDYALEVSAKQVKTIARKAAKVARDSGTYENRRPKYRQSITQKNVSKNRYIPTSLVYAKDHEYSLTHLLENGHKLWNAPGIKTRAFKHWKVADEYAREELPKAIAKGLGG